MVINMESLIKKEDELRRSAEGGEYYDILELADFLYDEKRYEEAKEQYLKIAGEDDLSGDANSHLFQMLLDTEEYEEAVELYGYIQCCCDTSPREGADVRLMQELCNPESKLFMYFDEESFYYDLLPFIDTNFSVVDNLSRLDDAQENIDCGGIETGREFLARNMEIILQTRTKSQDEEIQKNAKWDLLRLYLEGRFRFGDFSWKCANGSGRNIKKAIKASKIFAEYPDIIDEVFCDFSYFYTVIYDIYENYPEKCTEYARRFTVAALKYAEELGNVEEVLGKIESELYEEDCGYPFYLGYIPKGITRLPAISFSGGEPCNEELESIVIPGGITTISERCFFNCTSLKSVVIPQSVTSIGGLAFFGCGSLADIVIPSGVKSIEENTFYGCDSLTSVVIPDGVTSIGDEAFADCFRLTSIVIPASVTSIADDAFEWIGDWYYENDEDEECILTIKGYAGSYAEAYAKENGFPFEEI